MDNGVVPQLSFVIDKVFLVFNPNTFLGIIVEILYKSLGMNDIVLYPFFVGVCDSGDILKRLRIWKLGFPRKEG